MSIRVVQWLRGQNDAGGSWQMFTTVQAQKQMIKGEKLDLKYALWSDFWIFEP